VKIVPAARKHGIRDEDMNHALRNYLAVYDDQGEVAMFIGPARNGTRLERGGVLDDEEPRIVHAQKARAKYWP
jgi:hypothetical protein